MLISTRWEDNGSLVLLLPLILCWPGQQNQIMQQKCVFFSYYPIETLALPIIFRTMDLTQRQFFPISNNISSLVKTISGNTIT